MDFLEAMRHYKDGKKVRPKNWVPEDSCIFRNQGTLYNGICRKDLLDSAFLNVQSEWEILEEKDPLEERKFECFLIALQELIDEYSEDNDS